VCRIDSTLRVRISCSRMVPSREPVTITPQCDEIATVHTHACCTHIHTHIHTHTCTHAIYSQHNTTHRRSAHMRIHIQGTHTCVLHRHTHTQHMTCTQCPYKYMHTPTCCTHIHTQHTHMQNTIHRIHARVCVMQCKRGGSNTHTCPHRAAMWYSE